MSEIKESVGKVAKLFSKTSGDIVKQTKLSLSLANEESNLKSIYTDIGRKVHEIYSYGGSLGEYFDEKYMEIQKQESKIADIQNQLNTTKGTKPCPSCSADVQKTAVFCPKCGVKSV